MGLLSIIAYSGQVHLQLEMGWTYAPLLRELFSPPARMAPLTAFLFIGFGFAFVLLASSTPRGDAAGHAVALPLAIVSYMVLVGYLFHEDELHTWMNVAVAFNTGIAFLALSIGIFCVRPQSWFMRVFTSGGVGSLIARRLLPAVVVAPLLIGWLCFTAAGAGVLRKPLETTIVVISNAVLVLLVLWFTARSTNETDEQRRQSQDALRRSEERYRNLFVTMAEGFALHELICDTEGKPADYRFLEVNPAFEQLT
jgi:hypothetical protein